jgi:hypothetical protein
VTPADLVALWHDLASGSHSAAGFDRRRVFPDAAADLFACVFWPGATRGLMIEGDDAGPVHRRVPQCRGVVVGSVVMPGPRPRISIRIVLEDDRFIEIFAVLAVDLLNTVAREAKSGSGLNQSINRLAMWQGLFDRLPPDGMSAERQRGLFGEWPYSKRFTCRT